MPRPKVARILTFKPQITFFKPKGVASKDLQIVMLEPDEVEAIKLCDVDGLQQKQAATQMGISQPTFSRILHHAHQKVAEVLIFGKALKLKKTE